MIELVIWGIPGSGISSDTQILAFVFSDKDFYQKLYVGNYRVSGLSLQGIFVP